MSWTVLFTKQAQKDAHKLDSASAALQAKAQQLLDLLVGDLSGACSRRISIQHRLWSHYD